MAVNPQGLRAHCISLGLLLQGRLNHSQSSPHQMPGDPTELTKKDLSGSLGLTVIWTRIPVLEHLSRKPGRTRRDGSLRALSCPSPAWSQRLLTAALRRGTALIPILLVRKLRLCHHPRILWLVTGEGRIYTSLGGWWARFPYIKEV